MIMDHQFGSNCDQDVVSRASQRSWRPPDAVVTASMLVGLVAAATMVVAARAAIVSIAPATAGIYAGMGMPVNLRGLSIADIRATTKQQQDNSGELLVTGAIKNLRDSETAAPNLRLTLRNEDGREVYAWTVRAPKSSLGARERVPFRARLAAPPAGVRDVLVKFAEPGDKGSFTESPS
jgi:hypothetical protein